MRKTQAKVEAQGKKELPRTCLCSTNDALTDAVVLVLGFRKKKEREKHIICSGMERVGHRNTLGNMGVLDSLEKV